MAGPCQKAISVAVWPNCAGRLASKLCRGSLQLCLIQHTTSRQCSRLLKRYEESFVTQRRVLVFATTQDKDVRGMLELLLPKFESVVFTRYQKNPRAVPISELEQLAAELSSIPYYSAPDPSAAWHRARELATPDHLICITGSFYLAAEIRPAIVEASRADSITPLSATSPRP